MSFCAVVASRKTLAIYLTGQAPADAVALASITHLASRSGIDVVLHLQGNTIGDDSFKSTSSLNSSILVTVVSCNHIFLSALNCIRAISYVTVSSIAALFRADIPRRDGRGVWMADASEMAKL